MRCIRLVKPPRVLTPPRLRWSAVALLCATALSMCAADGGVEEWRVARRVAEWRDINALAGFRTPHAWERDPAACNHSRPFGAAAAYAAGCANGHRYSALPPPWEVTTVALCAQLAANGVRNISLLGDSFMRHLHVHTLSLHPTP
ncbi:hypothetical protein T484DRAFT_3615157 [Baffinella frigidus]|nr:hypothetical protein T484DRAFT_3615157 [Cryptophyta sp. CCMP2293]